MPGQQQQVYEAPWFLSYPGNSGGPLYVQLNGYYYPAAVYLGTRFSGAQPVSSLVRAIDSNVVNLITLAASQGDSGTNNTGGASGYSMFREGKIVWRSSEDIRQLIITYFTEQGTLPAKADENWRVVPAEARQTLEQQALRDATRSSPSQ